jgi:glutathione S-transferase
MLEEIGVPYRLEDTNIREGRQKHPDYLRINPMGKVPAITDHGAVVTECPAICLYLADRYAYGDLAPKIDDPRRGPYLRWSVFSTATVEPGVFWRPPVEDPVVAAGRGWGDYASIIRTLETALDDGRPWILGDAFSAADVALGGVILMAMFNKRLPTSGPIKSYHDRLAARPACQRASKAIWPPEVFGPS